MMNNIHPELYECGSIRMTREVSTTERIVSSLTSTSMAMNQLFCSPLLLDTFYLSIPSLTPIGQEDKMPKK